jgi:hypothetical protein
MKKYRVTLMAEERAQLREVLARGKADVRTLKHAQILLKADEAEGGPGWSDECIVAALEVGTATVERVRRRFVIDGLAAALRCAPCTLQLAWRRRHLAEQQEER